MIVYQFIDILSYKFKQTSIKLLVVEIVQKLFCVIVTSNILRG